MNHRNEDMRFAFFAKTPLSEEHRLKKLEQMLKKNPVWEEILNDYKFENLIGNGAFG